MRPAGARLEVAARATGSRRAGLRRRAAGGRTGRATFSGSFDSAPPPSTLAIWYARDSKIRRCRALIDQPSATNRRASQSSSSGCDGRLAPRAEVAGRGDDPPAEVVLPDPIDQHPGRQRVRLRVSQPVRRAPAARSRRHGRPVLAPQDGQEPPRDLGPQVLGVAPALEAGVAGAGRTRPWRRPGGAWLRAARRRPGARSPWAVLRLLRAGEGVTRAGEDAVEGVILLARDRVELVVVAPAAGDRQAEDRLAQRVDRVLDRQVVVVLRVEAEAAGDGQEPGGDDPRVAASRSASSSRSPAICSRRNWS